jgi:hypothetical protein
MHMKPVLAFCVSFLLVWSAGASSPNQESSSAAPAQSSARTRGQQTVPAAHPTVPAARPDDVDSIEHIIAAVYDVISGPAGKRDWNRFRSLFFYDARLIPNHHYENGVVPSTRVHRVLTPEEYMERSRDLFDKKGLFIKSVAKRVESWDQIAHVWSTYESRHAAGDTKPFVRGIDSFQLLNDGRRWWILTMYWQSEDPAHPLPEKYFK